MRGDKYQDTTFPQEIDKGIKVAYEVQQAVNEVKVLGATSSSIKELREKVKDSLMTFESRRELLNSLTGATRRLNNSKKKAANTKVDVEMKPFEFAGQKIEVEEGSFVLPNWEDKSDQEQLAIIRDFAEELDKSNLDQMSSLVDFLNNNKQLSEQQKGELLDKVVGSAISAISGVESIMENEDDLKAIGNVMSVIGKVSSETLEAEELSKLNKHKKSITAILRRAIRNDLKKNDNLQAVEFIRNEISKIVSMYGGSPLIDVSGLFNALSSNSKKIIQDTIKAKEEAEDTLEEDEDIDSLEVKKYNALVWNNLSKIDNFGSLVKSLTALRESDKLTDNQYEMLRAAIAKLPVELLAFTDVVVKYETESNEEFEKKVFESIKKRKELLLDRDLESSEIKEIRSEAKYISDSITTGTNLAGYDLKYGIITVDGKLSGQRLSSAILEEVIHSFHHGISKNALAPINVSSAEIESITGYNSNDITSVVLDMYNSFSVDAESILEKEELTEEEQELLDIANKALDELKGFEEYKDLTVRDILPHAKRMKVFLDSNRGYAEAYYYSSDFSEYFSQAVESYLLNGTYEEFFNQEEVELATVEDSRNILQKIRDYIVNALSKVSAYFAPSIENSVVIEEESISSVEALLGRTLTIDDYASIEEGLRKATSNLAVANIRLQEEKEARAERESLLNVWDNLVETSENHRLMNNLIDELVSLGKIRDVEGLVAKIVLTQYTPDLLKLVNLSDIRVSEEGGSTLGSYRPITKSLKINVGTDQDFLSTFIHEIGHAIDFTLMDIALDFANLPQEIKDIANESDDIKQRSEVLKQIVADSNIRQELVDVREELIKDQKQRIEYVNEKGELKTSNLSYNHTTYSNALEAINKGTATNKQKAIARNEYFYRVNQYVDFIVNFRSDFIQKQVSDYFEPNFKEGNKPLPKTYSAIAKTYGSYLYFKSLGYDDEMSSYFSINVKEFIAASFANYMSNKITDISLNKLGTNPEVRDAFEQMLKIRTEQTREAFNRAGLVQNISEGLVQPVFNSNTDLETFNNLKGIFDRLYNSYIIKAIEGNQNAFLEKKYKDRIKNLLELKLVSAYNKATGSRIYDEKKVASDFLLIAEGHFNGIEHLSEEFYNIVKLIDLETYGDALDFYLSRELNKSVSVEKANKNIPTNTLLKDLPDFAKDRIKEQRKKAESLSELSIEDRLLQDEGVQALDIHINNLKDIQAKGYKILGSAASAKGYLDNKANGFEDAMPFLAKKIVDGVEYDVILWITKNFSFINLGNSNVTYTSEYLDARWDSLNNIGFFVTNEMALFKGNEPEAKKDFAPYHTDLLNKNQTRFRSYASWHIGYDSTGINTITGQITPWIANQKSLTIDEYNEEIKNFNWLKSFSNMSFDPSVYTVRDRSLLGARNFSADSFESSMMNKRKEDTVSRINRGSYRYRSQESTTQKKFNSTEKKTLGSLFNQLYKDLSFSMNYRPADVTNIDQIEVSFERDLTMFDYINSNAFVKDNVFESKDFSEASKTLIINALSEYVMLSDNAYFSGLVNAPTIVAQSFQTKDTFYVRDELYDRGAEILKDDFLLENHYYVVDGYAYSIKDIHYITGENNNIRSHEEYTGISDNEAHSRLKNDLPLTSSKRGYYNTSKGWVVLNGNAERKPVKKASEYVPLINKALPSTLETFTLPSAIIGHLFGNKLNSEELRYFNLPQAYWEQLQRTLANTDIESLKTVMNLSFESDKDFSGDQKIKRFEKNLTSSDQIVFERQVKNTQEKRTLLGARAFKTVEASTYLVNNSPSGKALMSRKEFEEIFNDAIIEFEIDKAETIKEIKRLQSNLKAYSLNDFVNEFKIDVTKYTAEEVKDSYNKAKNDKRQEIKDLKDSIKDSELNVFLADLIDSWKKDYLKKNMRGANILTKTELNYILKTPIRKKTSRYFEDIEYVEQIANNASFRKIIKSAIEAKKRAKKKAANTADVLHSIILKDLADIDFNIFKTQEEFGQYTSLVKSNPSGKDGIPIDTMRKIVDGWIKRQNDLVAEEEEEQGEEKVDIDPFKIESELDLANALVEYLTAEGLTLENGIRDLVAIVKDIEEGAVVNVSTMKKINAALIYAANNRTISHEHYKTITKFFVNKAIEDLNAQHEQLKFDVFNKMVENNPLKNFFSIRGNLTQYNTKQLLNIIGGEQLDYSNDVIKYLITPLEQGVDKMDKAINQVYKKLTPINYGITETDGRIISIVGLLTQLPTFRVDANTIKLLKEVAAEEGSNLKVENLPVVLRHNDNNEDAKIAYGLLSKWVNSRLKESIKLSYGFKPADMSEEEYEEHLSMMLTAKGLTKKDVDKRLQLIEKKVGMSLDQMLNKSTSELEAMLTKNQRIWLEDTRAEFKNISEGKYTNGKTLKYVTEVETGQEGGFNFIENYFPIVRYAEFNTVVPDILQTEDERQKTAMNNKQTVFANAFSDININNSFVRSRKSVVMSLDTDAWDVVRTRVNQQMFYLNNEAQRKFLQNFLTSSYWKENLSKESQKYITSLFEAFYNRGLTKAKAELRDNKVLKFIQKGLNIERVNALSDFIGNFKQVSSIPKAMQTMKNGNEAQKVQDLLWAVNQVTINVAETNEFLEENMIEIYKRGLVDYDIGLGSEPLTIKRMMQSIEGGDYKREKNYLGHLFKTYGSLKGFTDIQLATLIHFDRYAARVTALANYKNLLRGRGIEEVNLQDVDPIIAAEAVQRVRETQGSDNILYKPSVLVTAEQRVLGDGALAELINQSIWSFKSFALMEKSRRRRAMIDAYNGGLAEQGALARELIYDYIGKFMFHALKGMLHYSTYAAIARYLAPPRDEEAEDIVAQAKMLDPVAWATKSIRDYAIIDAVGYGVGQLMRKLDETFHGNSKEAILDIRYGNILSNLGLLESTYGKYEKLGRDVYNLYDKRAKTTWDEKVLTGLGAAIAVSMHSKFRVPFTPEYLRVNKMVLDRLERQSTPLRQERISDRISSKIK